MIAVKRVVRMVFEQIGRGNTGVRRLVILLLPKSEETW